MKKFRFNKFGMAENPVGHKVSMAYKGRDYMGDVISCRYEPVRGAFLLTVRHFNGEIWPMGEVTALSVDVIR